MERQSQSSRSGSSTAALNGWSKQRDIKMHQQNAVKSNEAWERRISAHICPWASLEKKMVLGKSVDKTQGGCVGETKNQNEQGGTRRGHRSYSIHHCPKVSQGKLLNSALHDTSGHAWGHTDPWSEPV